MPIGDRDYMRSGPRFPFLAFGAVPVIIAANVLVFLLLAAEGEPYARRYFMVSAANLAEAEGAHGVILAEWATGPRRSTRPGRSHLDSRERRKVGGQLCRRAYRRRARNSASVCTSSGRSIRV